MGLLVEGVWHDRGYEQEKSAGRFRRQDSGFRNFVTADGAPGPTGRGGFAAQAGRYHLYVAYFCPWAHRCLIMRELKGLQSIVSVSVADWLMRENGIPIVVFSIRERGGFLNVLTGKGVHTVIGDAPGA